MTANHRHINTLETTMAAKVPSPFNPSAEMTADLPSRLCGITSDATILFRDLSMALPMMP